MFLGKGVLKISSKFTGEHPCRSAISITLPSNFTETSRRHGYSPVNLLHIFRTLFSRNISGWLLLFLVFRMKIFLLKTQIIVKLLTLHSLLDRRNNYRYFDGLFYGHPKAIHISDFT